MRQCAIMACPYNCTTLEARAAASAYSLIEAAGLSLAYSEWLEAVQRTVGSTDAGVMGVHTELGRIHGVYLYRVREEVNGSAVFYVPYFIAFEIHGPSVTEIMIASAEKLAMQQNCDYVEICLDHVSGTRLLGRATGGTALFNNGGYNVSGLRLRKALRQAGASRNLKEGSF